MNPKALELLSRAKKILIITGAGVSTASGIPDFRSANGLWRSSDIVLEDFFAEAMKSEDHATRARFWNAMLSFKRLLRGDEELAPCRVHHSLQALLEAKGLRIVTQNIDRLHQNVAKDLSLITPIHGSKLSLQCKKCDKIYNYAEIQLSSDGDAPFPQCRCGNIDGRNWDLGAIMFGQDVPHEFMTELFQAAGDCDLCLIVGTSCRVDPVYSAIMHVYMRGAPLIVANDYKTPFDDVALVLRGDVNEELCDLIKEALDGNRN